ncbi:Rust resistance kinase Lr10 [Linum perenne]
MINSITITSILCCLILLLSNSAESFNLSCRTTPTCTSSSSSSSRTTTNTTSDNSIIKFPFTIKGSPSGYSGFPGFELSCDASNNNDNNPILLHLPNSVNFTLLSIDYQSQTVHVNSPDDCLPRQLRDLPRIDDSTAFRIEGKLPVYSFFDCPKLTHITQSMTSVPCLGSKVYVYPALSPVNDVDLVSCTKMFDGPYREDHGLELSWSNPDCGRCYRKKGQCCVLKKGSSEPEAECSGVTDEKKVSPLKKAVIAGVILGSASIAALLYALYRAHRFDRNEKEFRLKIEKFLDDYNALKPTRFSYADIKRITNNFDSELGRGAYGTVFKGKLSSEIQVAVKVLDSSTIGDGEDFVNEVRTMARIHHVNVVRLIGFCADGFRRALVYEYLPHDTLQKYIDQHQHQTVRSKFHDIALGVAKGIEYLHQGCEQRILHFDIKPHNVLLDREFNPKISDFGMAKLCAKDQSAISMTTARGTIGYIAPEVFSRNFGNVSYKADVYSFGMLLLEMVGGRKNVDFTSGDRSEIYFPEWIYNLFDQSGDDVRVDVEEEEEEDGKIAKKLAVVGLWCIQWNPVDRPSMKLAVQMLEGEGDDLTAPPNPVSSSSGGASRMAKSMMQLQELEIVPEMESTS